MTAETTITIRRSPQDVFAFLADPRNDPLWCTRVRCVEPAGNGEYRVLHKPLRIQPKPYELRMRLLDSDPPHRLRWEETDRDGTLVVDYVLSPAPDGTRFTQRTDLSGLRARVRVLARFTIARHIAEQARALKEHLERG
jgi:uncharacterized protein YndB with AHSA1/START domain